MTTNDRGHRDTDAVRPMEPSKAPGKDDVSGRKDPPSKQEEEREINTPGDGAGPDTPREDEADPGLG